MKEKIIIIQLILICATVILISGCGYVEETNFLQSDSGGASDFFNINWRYRQPVTIDNTQNASDLTNYQINVELDNSNTDFWNNVENDGRSIRFTDSNKTTLIDFWIEKFDFSGQSAFIWIEVPTIPASANKNIYMYYGNNTAVSSSDGSASFIFFDDFEDGDASDWTNYGSGAVAIAADPLPPAGVTSNYSLEKINNSDPHGGWKIIGITIGLGYIFEGRIYRIDPYNGGASDRLAVENSFFNGYGLNTNHTLVTNYVAIERRDTATGTTIGSSITYNPPENTWYKYSFYLKPGGSFVLFYYDIDNTPLTSVPDLADGNHTSFDRVVLRGGFEYYADDMRIRIYTNPDPTTSIGNQETQ